MAAAADDQMVVHGDTDRRRCLDDIAGDSDVGLRWRRVAGRVVVHQDQRRRVQFKRPLDDLARIDRGVIDRAALLPLVFDQRVLAVEKQQVKLPAL